MLACFLIGLSCSGCGQRQTASGAKTTVQTTLPSHETISGTEAVSVTQSVTDTTGKSSFKKSTTGQTKNSTTAKKAPTLAGGTTVTIGPTSAKGTPPISALYSWRYLPDGSLLLLLVRPGTTYRTFDVFLAKADAKTLKITKAVQAVTNQTYDSMMLFDDGACLIADSKTRWFDANLQPCAPKYPDFPQNSVPNILNIAPDYQSAVGFLWPDVSRYDQQKKIASKLFTVQPEKAGQFMDFGGSVFLGKQTVLLMYTYVNAREGMVPTLCLLGQDGKVQAKLLRKGTDSQLRSSDRYVLAFDSHKIPYGQHTSGKISLIAKDQVTIRTMSLSQADESGHVWLSKEGDRVITAVAAGSSSTVRVYATASGKLLAAFTCPGASVEQALASQQSGKLHLLYQKQAGSEKWEQLTVNLP